MNKNTRRAIWGLTFSLVPPCHLNRNSPCLGFTVEACVSIGLRTVSPPNTPVHFLHCWSFPQTHLMMWHLCLKSIQCPHHSTPLCAEPILNALAVPTFPSAYSHPLGRKTDMSGQRREGLGSRTRNSNCSAGGGPAWRQQRQGDNLLPAGPDQTVPTGSQAGTIEQN